MSAVENLVSELENTCEITFLHSDITYGEIAEALELAAAIYWDAVADEMMLDGDGA